MAVQLTEDTDGVSIHASVMEATRARRPARPRSSVSIHASVMEATLTATLTPRLLQFRSTPP